MVLCWAVTKNDMRRINALDQWCLRMLLGINWHQHALNDKVRRLTKQPHLSAIVQSRRLFLFGHIARMSDETDAKQILRASPAGNWRRPLGRPRITWMKTVQQDLKSSDLDMDDAVDLAQNRPLWRLMSTFAVWHYALLVVLARNDDDDCPYRLVDFICVFYCIMLRPDLHHFYVYVTEYLMTIIVRVCVLIRYGG